ncbi:MAG: type II secretion system protein [Pyrinomonadaceae bacterium]
MSRSKESRREEGRGTGHRVRLNLHSSSSAAHRVGGFTLLELIIVLTVLAILAAGIVPLVKISVKRSREQQLRETLREMRTAIEQFHRDTIGGPCGGTQQIPTASNQQQQQSQAVIPQQGGPNGGQPQPFIDPRSNVVISDCTVFGVDNPDRYPPDLDALVKGVNILPRGGGGGGYGDSKTNATEVGGGSATDGALATKKKVYLRSIPIDPMTGQAEWDLRSSYDAPDSGSWGGENVFDVRSKSTATALNGEKYSDW